MERLTYEIQARESKREMLNGESHYFLGQRYRLNVVEYDGPCDVAIRNKSIIDFKVRSSLDAEQRLLALHEWYRDQLRDLVPPLLEKWSSRLGVKVPDWGIKKMKTKWGSCNPKDRRIWINLELAKKPVQCLEYIIVHELVHLRERQHDDNFSATMNSLLPKWRAYREELNQTPMGHEKWIHSEPDAPHETESND